MIILYITIIANFPLYGQKIDKIQLNSDYQFCGTKSNNDIQLNQPVDFIVTENHDLIVCDKKDNCIVIFNSKGELIEKFGRFGQGPGEFNRPEKIGFIGGNLIVLDCGNLRIQVVNPKGEYVRAHPIPAICSIMLDYNRISFLSNGSYLYNPAGYQSTNLIISNSIDGKILNKYGEIKGEAKDYLDSGKKLIKRGRIPDLYKNSVFPVQKMDGKIYCIHTSIPKVKQFQSNGELLWEQEINIPEMKLIFEKWKKSNRDTPANVTYRLKYWRDVTVADNGDLFLLLNLDDKMRIYRISNEGKVLKCYFGNIKDISMIDIVGDDLYAYDKQTQTFFHFELPAID